MTRPDGLQIGVTYDAAGRASAVSVPGGELLYDYDPITGSATSVAGPYGSGLSFTYDGRLLTGVNLTGEVAGNDVEYSTAFMMPAQSDLNPELERIWAYATIENLQAKMDYFGADQDTEDAITDLAVEYGLVTDYTSMIVVRDEVFAAQGIRRSNRDRVATERVAQQVRATQAPQNRRVDQQRPMYTKRRPSTGGGGSGGGAMGLPMLLPLVGLALFRRRKQNAI